MEENNEGLGQHQERKLPPWAEDIKISYEAYQQANQNSKNELGRLNRPGIIDEKYETQIRERFYDFLGSITPDELTEAILLRKGVNAGLSFQTNQGLQINLYADPSTEYYIPRRNIIYRIQTLERKPTESKYVPDNENFVGLNTIDPKHPPYGVHFESLEPPYHLLTGDQIDIILKSLEDSIKQEPNKAMLYGVKQEIENLQEQLTIEYSNREEELAQQLKTRILNLRDSVARHFRLPKQIGGSSVKDNREVYFLTEEGRLVLVPIVEKKTYFGKTKGIPDFTKAEDAPTKQWLRTGLLAIDLLRPLPHDIRDVIKSS